MKKRDIKKFQGIVFKIIDENPIFNYEMPDDVWAIIKALVSIEDKKTVAQLFDVSNGIVKDSIKEEIKKRFDKEMQ